MTHQVVATIKTGDEVSFQTSVEMPQMTSGEARKAVKEIQVCRVIIISVNILDNKTKQNTRSFLPELLSINSSRDVMNQN